MQWNRVDPDPKRWYKARQIDKQVQYLHKGLELCIQKQMEGEKDGWKDSFKKQRWKGLIWCDDMCTYIVPSEQIDK